MFATTREQGGRVLLDLMCRGQGFWYTSHGIQNSLLNKEVFSQNFESPAAEKPCLAGRSVSNKE